MGAMKLEKFGGMLPAWDPNLVPEGQAVKASNAYLYSGALEGWREPTLLRSLTNSAAKFVYRLPVNGKAVATAFLNFISIPVQGDTVQVGEIIYTWLNTINTNSPAYSVLISSTTVQSANNLLNAITADNGLLTNQGVSYGPGTGQNPAIAGLSNQLGAVNGVLPVTNVGLCMQIIGADFGANYNAIPVVSSAPSRMLWLLNTATRANTTTTLQGGANATQSTSITGTSTFLEFLDPDTTVVKSQTALDQYERYYFASPSQPPQYNTRLRINAGQPAFLLGVPAPPTPPALEAIGGGAAGTLGPTVGNGGGVFVGANTCYLLPVIPDGSFQLNDIQFIPNNDDPNVNWQTVIYQDNNPNTNKPTFPGQLCSASPINTGISNNVPSQGVFTNPCTTIPNVVYWIGVIMDTTENLQTGDKSFSSATFTSTFANGPPQTAPQCTFGQADLAMWVDLTSSSVQESRSYVYTYISAYGEEGPPSPFTIVNGWDNATWVVGLSAPPILDMGVQRNLAVIRIYRSVTSDTGLSTYFQVADISLGSTDPDAINFAAQDVALAPTLTYQDNFSDTQVAQNIQLVSTNYFFPPQNLQGFLNLPNGGIAAFRNQEIWFCEPYLPHAWPFGYMQTVDYPIVGLGLTNGAVIALTASVPFVCQFVNPQQITVFKCSAPAPCLSRGSIVSLDEGVVFMSPNGLVQIPSSGQLSNLSETWIKREDWAQLTPQKNTRAVYLAGMYYCWGTTNGTDASVAQQGFSLELNTDISSFGVWPQPGGHRIGFMELTSVLGNIDNVYNDPWSGQTVFVAGGAQYFIDFTNASPIIQPYDFLTKKYREVSKKNFSALRVFFTPYATSPPTRNQQPNLAPPFDPSWNTLQTQQLGIIKVWADVNDGFQDGSMQIVMARELTKNGQIMRIPDGFKAESWQVEVMARVKITNIQIATSVDELGEI